MSFAQTFSIGYLKTRADRGEEIFLSVTDRFECGPGIMRDGVTIPRMKDPHSLSHIVNKPLSKTRQKLPHTTNPYVQRAGTWTLFHHLERFVRQFGDDYQVIGIQSCGDLTMNPWHVALVQRQNGPELCRFHDGDKYEEPFKERTYRCLVKWKRDLGIPWQYDFIDLQFSPVARGFSATIADKQYMEREFDGKTRRILLKRKKIDVENIAPFVDFALSGKPIIQRGSEIPLDTVIDRFEDVRHIFNLPTIPAVGRFKGIRVNEINFGEHELYTLINARRAALHSPVIIPINWDGVSMNWSKVDRALKRELFKPDPVTPTRRGQYRRYSDEAIEIFYPYNVYPFGVLGGKPGELVCLASGGLSGRIGNTLTGITTIMYDFFGCEDALVLDEGYDTFHVVNPNSKAKEGDPDLYDYNNQELLDEIALFTKTRFELDREECRRSLSKKKYVFGEDMASWPLNKELALGLEAYLASRSLQPLQDYKSMAVKPNRSQIRAVLIFAVRRVAQKSAMERTVRRGRSELNENGVVSG